jgi:hypothetical protein
MFTSSLEATIYLTYEPFEVITPIDASISVYSFSRTKVGSVASERNFK